MADDIKDDAEAVKEEPQTVEDEGKEDEAEGDEALGFVGDNEEFYEEDEGDEEESSKGEEEEGEEDITARELKVTDNAFVEEAWGETPGEGEEGEVEVEGEGEVKVEEEEEEEGIYEEPPVDPAAPYNLSDESEAKKAPFSLNEEQMAEVTEIWESFQNYTPAYTNIDNYVTSVELVYMLKAMNLHTHTPEQLMELIEFCVRPPNEDNHVNFEQFVWIVTIRQRDMPIEEEIRLALEVMDPMNNGVLDREYVREVVRDHGNGMKTVDAFIKEVDMSNDGILGIEDIVGTICLDLNRDDIDHLLNLIYPPGEAPEDNIEALTT